MKVRVNGEEVEAEVEPRLLLAHFIREKAGLTGTHVGCVSGKCGCCTVIVDGEPVKSCMMFSVQANGSDVLTIEGLGKDGTMHPIQEAFWESDALECGFCTPGMIMAAYALLNKNPTPTEQEIRRGMVGNLCRCTGYLNIIKAVQSASEKIRGVK